MIDSVCANTKKHALQPFIRAHRAPLMFALVDLTCQSHSQAGTYTHTHTHTDKKHTQTLTNWQRWKIDYPNWNCRFGGFQLQRWAVWTAGWVSRSVSLSVSSSLTSFFSFPWKTTWSGSHGGKITGSRQWLWNQRGQVGTLIAECLFHKLWFKEIKKFSGASAEHKLPPKFQAVFFLSTFIPSLFIFT